jgi:hypothetical protein
VADDQIVITSQGAAWRERRGAVAQDMKKKSEKVDGEEDDKEQTLPSNSIGWRWD